jgi:hypothetical protein
MNSSRILTNILWIPPLLLQAAIAVAMVRCKLVRAFPLFFAYTAAVVSVAIALLFLRYPGNLYAEIYWYGEVLTIVLALGAIFETVRHLTPPYPFLKFVLRLFGALAVIAAFIAIGLLVHGQEGAGGERVLAVIMLAERSLRFVEACWLILVILLISNLGRTWQQYSVGIVAGFGIHSALTLALFELRAHLHLLSYPKFAMLNSAAYNIAVLVWAFYFLRPERIPALPHLPVTNLSKWNHTVTEFYTQQWYRRY